jgi:tRNA(Ile)-lysidine synthetase-like protein
MASLPGLAVRREHGDVVFYHGVAAAAPPPDHTSLTLRLGETIELRGYRVSARVVPPRAATGEWRSRSVGSLESAGGLSSSVAYFARESVQPPFTIRPPALGDRMRPFGMSGRKKLSDIFIDRKIPYRCRSNALVVEDRREIVWLAGVTTSESTRVTDETREVVELRVDLE